MKVVVIGAGVAGLAAAYDLVRAGHEVVVAEGAPFIGGQVRTFEVGGGRLESFYHHLFLSDTAIIGLIEELGLGRDLDWIDSNVALHAGGRVYPFVGPVDLLRFTRVSLLTRARLGLTALWLRRQRDWPRYQGQRAAAWIRRMVGRQGYDEVWGPLLRAKFGQHAEEVSLVWFWGKIHLRFASRRGGLFAREQLGYLRGSFGRLVDATAAAIEAHGGRVLTATPVERIVVEDGRAVGVALGGAHQGAVERADAVLATVPSSLFLTMAPEVARESPEYARMLESVQYQWATVLVLALDRPLSSVYWLTMTDPDCPFVLAVEQTNLRPASEYGGLHPVYFSNYVDPHDPIIDEDEETVLTRYEGWIRRINPAFDRSWIRGLWLFKDRAGQPIVHARYHETIPPHRTPIPGLYLANTTQIYPEDRGQNYSIRMGRQVARLVVEESGAASGDLERPGGAAI